MYGDRCHQVGKGLFMLTGNSKTYVYQLPAKPLPNATPGNVPTPTSVLSSQNVPHIRTPTCFVQKQPHTSIV